MKKSKKSYYVAVVKHDQGRKRIRVSAKRVEKVVHQILCAERCPKCAIVSITKKFKSGARLKLKNW